MGIEDRSADFLPTANWANLRRRADLLRRLRQFFDERGFLEVETPLLSAETVVDRHLDLFQTTFAPDPRSPNVGRRLWLQTSPEAGMKRLMAAGGDAIYQVTRSFRNGERGPLHNPEFTIVEWYRRGDRMDAGIELLDALCQMLLGAKPATRITYGQAMQAHAGINPHHASAAQLATAVRNAGLVPPDGLEQDDRDAWLDFLWIQCVERHLGRERPQIVCEYPASQAALAQVSGDPPVAERFELYVDGIELANGYHEILDPDVLRRRTEKQNTLRRGDGKSALDAPGRLIAAMEHGLPACTGCALGFDRLVMLAVGADSIDEVMPFPIDRA